MRICAPEMVTRSSHLPLKKLESIRIFTVLLFLVIFGAILVGGERVEGHIHLGPICQKLEDPQEYRDVELPWKSPPVVGTNYKPLIFPGREKELHDMSSETWRGWLVKVSGPTV